MYFCLGYMHLGLVAPTTAFSILTLTVVVCVLGASACSCWFVDSVVGQLVSRSVGRDGE